MSTTLNPVKYETPFLWVVVSEYDEKVEVKGKKSVEIHQSETTVLAYNAEEAIQVACGTKGTLRHTEDMPRIILVKRVHSHY